MSVKIKDLYHEQQMVVVVDVPAFHLADDKDDNLKDCCFHLEEEEEVVVDYCCCCLIPNHPKQVMSHHDTQNYTHHCYLDHY